MSTLSPDLVLLIGNPRPGSRTRALAEHVASRIASSRAHTLELAELTAISYTAVPVAAGYPDDNALDAVRSARVLVVATPSYKGTYTGLLKLFLDRLPHRGLEGVVALPVAVGASPAHVEQTASDLAALLVELGAEVPAKVAVLEAELESPDVGAAVAAVERSVVAGARP